MPGRRLLAPFAALALAGPAAAGPVTVFTGVRSAGGSDTGEIPVPGLGAWAVLTWGGGLDPAVTVAAAQTSARGPVVGYWPVMGFAGRAQYDAQRGLVVAVPDTPVRLSAEVWDGDPARPGTEHQTLTLDATVSGTVGPGPGSNAVRWQFPAAPVEARFSDGTGVTVGYQAVPMPDGTPQIQFADGSPALGFPGPIYYPSVVDADVEVTRTATEPGGSGGSGGTAAPPGVPEPATAVLLAGLAAGGWVAGQRVRACRPAPGDGPSRAVSRVGAVSPGSVR